MDYIMTSAKFNGKILFKYNLNGFISAFEFDGEPSRAQVTWLFSHFPLFEQGLKDPVFKHMNIVEVPPDLSFDAFWKAWGKGEGKARAERLWEKMSKADKIIALANLKPYFRMLNNNPQREKLHCSTYLNPKNRRFEEYIVKE